MDNLTHSLTGLALSRAGFSSRTQGATLALVLASNLPDLDLLAGLDGAATYLEHHRDLTHSVFGAPVLAVILAAALARAIPRARFWSLLQCSLAGVSLHVVMDLWTTYGTRVLAPWSREWFAWDLVFIVDPWLLLALGGGIFFAAPDRHGQRAARAALLAAGLYVGARFGLHQSAVRAARAAVPQPAFRVAALPDPVDPREWRVLVDAGDSYHVGRVSLFSPPSLERREKLPESPFVARVRESSAVASIFLDFSRWPWLEVKESPAGSEVVWRDLRFETPAHQGFVTRILVDRSGQVSSESLSF